MSDLRAHALGQLRKALCWLGWFERGHVQGDNTHIWLECHYCGKQIGKVWRRPGDWTLDL